MHTSHPATFPLVSTSVQHFRDAKVIDAIVSGRAKTLTGALREAGFNPQSSSVREGYLTPGRRQHDDLQKALEANNLTIERVLGTVSKNLDAMKVSTVAGEPHSQPDADAQLRAAEVAIKLHERAGNLPTIDNTAVSGGITVNILVAASASGPAPNVPPTQVIDSIASDGSEGQDKGK